MPPGADAVIMVEYTEEADGKVTLHRQVRSNAEVRPVAQDIAEGQQVLQAGACLGPQEIGLLASLGRTSVLAHPRPQVAVLSSGNEIIEPDAIPGPGQIRDSNRYTLMAAVQRAGAEAVSLGIGSDTREALSDKIVEGLATCDALVTSGGVSMGKLDLIKPILETIGQVHFGRVNMKPGKPLDLCTVPTNPSSPWRFPVSSLVASNLCGRRVAADGRPPPYFAAAGAFDTGRRAAGIQAGPEFHRVQLTRTPEGLTPAVPVCISARLFNGRCHGLLGLPKRAEPFSRRRDVEAILLDHPETEPYVAE